MINFDQREVKKYISLADILRPLDGREAYQGSGQYITPNGETIDPSVYASATVKGPSIFDSGQAYDGGWINSYGDVYDKDTYDAAIQDQTLNKVFAGGYGPDQGNGTPAFDYYNRALGLDFEKSYVKDYYSNRDIYNAESRKKKSYFADYLGINDADSDSLNSLLYSYDPNFDYRTGNNEYETDNGGRGRRSISSDPQKQAALDYLYQFQDAKRTSRRKSHQGATLAGILAFVTAGAAGALAAPAAAAGTGTGVAAGTGAAGGVAGAGAGAGAAASTGGLFVGSGGFLGSAGSALADAALNQAIQSAITSGISGGNPLKGALTGGLTAGFGNLAGGFDFGLGADGNSALAAALKGGLSSGISGGNPLIGGALGGLGSIGSSLFKNGTSGFQFGDQDAGTEGVSFGGADGGSNGFRLPAGYNPDSNFDFSNSINNPFGSTENGGALSDFNFNDIGGGDDFISNFFDGQAFGQGDIPLDLGGAFDSSNPESFIDQYFGGLGTSGDPSIDSFLSQYLADPSKVINLADSGGALIDPSAIQLAPDTLQNLVTKYGSNAVKALLGGGSGGSALTGLLSGLGGGGLGGSGGGGGGGNNVPQFYTDGVQDLLRRGRAIADQPFESYAGQGVAPIDPNQQRAAELAASSEGAFAGDIDRARTFNQDGSRAFTEADINAYINPYVRGALDPVADRLRESAAMERTRNNALSVQRGAFGGSRGAVTDALTERGLEDNLRQLYGTGYANAYTNAQGQFNADRSAKQNAASGSLNIANTGTNLVNNDVNRLGTTGTVRRGALNDANDFGYKEFIRKQDYPAKQFGALTGAFGLQQPSALNNEPNKFVQGLGALTAGYGLYNSIFN